MKVECSPINPSDLGKIGMASRFGSVTAADGGGVQAAVPAGALPEGFSMQCGNEAAGIVVAAGAHADAQALLGKRVAIKTGCELQCKCQLCFRFFH